MKTRRRRYLVAYDIREPGRLRRICKLMEAHGERLQYSVFICDLNRSELIHLRAAGEKIMNLAVDSVVIVDLGEIGEDRFIFVGHHEDLTHQRAADCLATNTSAPVPTKPLGSARTLVRAGFTPLTENEQPFTHALAGRRSQTRVILVVRDQRNREPFS